MNDKKLFKWVILLLLMPIGLAYFGGYRFRYACQDTANWDKEMCKKPLCDVTRTCPEHIFKGGRDPRLGPPPDQVPQGSTSTPAPTGVNCK